MILNKPLEEVNDNVNEGQQFQLDIVKNEDVKDPATYFIRETAIEDEQLKKVFEYGDLDAIDDWHCGILLEDFELPEPLVEKHIDTNCCIRFDVQSVPFTVCSLE